MLSLFGIDQVPVLVVRTEEGYTFVKGEKNIIAYVRLACFRQEPVMFLEHPPAGRSEDITLFSEDDANCSIDINCDDPNAADRSVLPPQLERATP